LLGASYQLLPERATSIAALRGRNTLALGNSQTSSIAQEELLRGMWTIDFEPPLGRVAIVDQKTPGRPTPFLGEYGKPGEPTWCRGLITVLTTEGAANDARTVIISGITPTGTDAAMDYFSSATALRDLPALPGRGLCGASERLSGGGQVPLQGHLPAGFRVCGSQGTGSLSTPSLTYSETAF
jgi:hypothetical protein